MRLRTLVVWCADWPATSAVLDGRARAGDPVAVLHANRVIACSPSARAEGVECGLRRREAQSRCAELSVLAADPAAQARAFEPVVASVGELSPLVEVVAPGRLQLAVRGPARYFGGEERLAGLVRTRLARCGVEAGVGVADTPHAAALAARRAAVSPGAPGDSADGVGQWLVAAGSAPTTAFLAGHPLNALEVVCDDGGDPSLRREVRALVDCFRRLGLRTFADLAALPAADVLGRFGPVGRMLHALAAGEAGGGLDPVPVPPDLVVACELDPPVERVDAAAFAARGLAEELLAGLATRGLACQRVRIAATTEHGAELERLWRHERAGAAGGITAVALADRVRWQLEGWLAAGGVGALTRIELAPDEVVPDSGRQLDLFGIADPHDERAARAFARLQGLLGPDAVGTVVCTGGRSPGEPVRFVPWGDDRAAAAAAGPAAAGGSGHDTTTARARARDGAPPWPGSLPGPLPSTVFGLARPVQVLAADGTPVRVSGRLLPSAAPAALAGAGTGTGTRPTGGRSGGTRSPGGCPTGIRPAGTRTTGESDLVSEVVAWAGPWPVDERWWDPATHRRRARFQLQTADGGMHLVSLEAGTWWLEAEWG